MKTSKIPQQICLYLTDEFGIWMLNWFDSSEDLKAYLIEFAENLTEDHETFSRKVKKMDSEKTLIREAPRLEEIVKEAGWRQLWIGTLENLLYSEDELPQKVRRQFWEEFAEEDSNRVIPENLRDAFVAHLEANLTNG